MAMSMEEQYRYAVCRAREQAARDVIQGLMEIAEIAMPDTFFQSDSRTTAAREWLKD